MSSCDWLTVDQPIDDAKSEIISLLQIIQQKQLPGVRLYTVQPFPTPTESRYEGGIGYG